MTNKETIYHILENHYAVNVMNDNVNEQTKLTNDLAFDSLDIVELGLILENELIITIPDEQVEDWQTIQDVLNTLNQLRPE